MAPQRKSVFRPGLMALLVAVLATIGLVQVAQANGGSNGPTPYTVDANGITLPSGDVFPDNGHVNVRTAVGKTAGVHFEGKCINRTDAECAGSRHDQAQFIGKGFIPWSAFGIDPAKECVVWVQISHYNQHFGEGGQDPVGKCKGSETPKPTEPVEPCPTATVTTTVPGPTVTATATETVPVPGPTATVTQTVPVPGPTTTVTAPGPTVTATEVVPGPTVTATATETVVSPGPTVTATQTVPGPTTTVTIPGPTATATETVPVPGPTTTATATATATATETVTVPGPTATATATTTVTAQPTAVPTSTVTTTVMPTPAPTVTVTQTLTPAPAPTVFKTVRVKQPTVRPGLPNTGN